MVVTNVDADRPDRQKAQLIGLSEIKDAVAEGGIELEVEFDPTGHDRKITTDTGWRIQLGRGLDIFQPFTSTSSMTSAFGGRSGAVPGPAPSPI